MSKDWIKLKGVITLTHKDSNWKLISEETINNLIVNAGKAAVAGLIGATGWVAAFTYLALGSNNTAPAAGQTALSTEITTNGWQRAAATVSRVTTTVTNDTLQLVKVFTATGALTVEEVGIFNASSSGDMLGRALTGTKTLASGDTLTVTYKVVLS